MDSTDKKIKRMKVFKLRVENKAGKTDFFHNVSEILLDAMGWYYILYSFRKQIYKISHRELRNRKVKLWWVGR